MKIALCLSGQIRSFKEGFDYINKNLLSEWDVDVYFHTWSKNWNAEVINLYKPKSILVEDDSVFQNFSFYRSTRPRHYVLNPARNTILLYRSIKYADLLRRENEYDWVIRTRFDFALNTNINFNTLDNKKIYFCNTRMNNEKTQVHDQFAIGSSKNIKIYSDLYDYIDLYHNQGCIINGEDILEYHLNKNNLLGKHIEYLDLNPPFVGGMYNWGKHSLIRTDMEKWI